MVAKLSSVRTMDAASLETSASRNSHGYADVSLFQSRRVVYTVSSHGNDITLILPGTDDPDFVLRRYPGVYGNLFYIIPQFLIGHGINEPRLHRPRDSSFRIPMRFAMAAAVTL